MIADLSEQEVKCDNYQLAVQSLAADSRLHTLFDETRHKGKNTMDYTTPGQTSVLVDYNIDDDSGEGQILQNNSAICLDKAEGTESDDIAMEDEVEVIDDAMEPDHLEDDDQYIEIIEDDDDAYDTINLEGNGLQKTEQGGVLHLVPGWIQQAQPKKVSRYV